MRYDSYPVLEFQLEVADDEKHHGYIDVTFQSLVGCLRPTQNQKQHYKTSKQKIHSM